MEAGAQARCAVWGVLNVTPDSFSDGGRYLDPSRALAHAEAMLGAGADVVDVGGESSRPAGGTYGQGYREVAGAEELDRVLPVVEGLVARGAVVSVDTVKATVARAACAAGATYVNVVAAEPSIELLEAARDAGAELVLMHNRGRGEVTPENARYVDVVQDVLRELEVSVARAVAVGVPEARIWIDPGVGFAKTPAQSLRLLGATSDLVATGRPVLVGASRKSFIAAVERGADGREPSPLERLGGSVAAATLAALGGARAVRVHDVAETRQAVRVVEAVRGEVPTVRPS